VVAIYNVESDGAVPFLVMQYVPGRSLQARVDEDGPLAVEEVLRIGVQAAAGLAAAHRQGLVHRDVKPSNILLEDTVERAVLTDFGLARAMDDASLTQTGVVAGTPHYMSPEQATGQPIDHRSDLFSLGSVLYFMASGRPPFRAQGTLAVLNRICHERHRPLWQLNSSIPDELIDVIDRLLEKKPGRRFSSAEEVGQRLAGLLSRLQQRGLGRRRFRWQRVRQWQGKGPAAAAVICLAVAAFAVLHRLGSESPPVSNNNSVTETPSQPETPPAPPAIVAGAADFDHLIQEADQFTAHVEQTLQATQRAAATSTYLHVGDDSWWNEVNSLRRDLSRLEADPAYSPVK
jgi:serine/threonine-protein kinase